MTESNTGINKGRLRARSFPAVTQSMPRCVRSKFQTAVAAARSCLAASHSGTSIGTAPRCSLKVSALSPSRDSNGKGRDDDVEQRHGQEVVVRDPTRVVDPEHVERVPREGLLGIEVGRDKLGSGRLKCRIESCLERRSIVRTDRHRVSVMKVVPQRSEM